MTSDVRFGMKHDVGMTCWCRRNPLGELGLEPSLLSAFLASGLGRVVHFLVGNGALAESLSSGVAGLLKIPWLVVGIITDRLHVVAAKAVSSPALDHLVLAQGVAFNSAVVLSLHLLAPSHFGRCNCHQSGESD